MTVSLEQLARWMGGSENEHLEFKEAKSHFDFEDLVRYCAALANEGGGHIVLGVTDQRPRKVVGSRAFSDLERTKAGLIDRLHIRIAADLLHHPDGPVVVFTVPPRPLGIPIAVRGAYWMRAGESLAPMTPDMLKSIFDEAGPDFSAEICRGATPADLDAAAIAKFRSRWLRKSGNRSLEQLSDLQLLRDAELLIDSDVTYAALVLFGTREALGRYLAQSEVIFEYRASEASGPASQRDEFRKGFFSFEDDLWSLLNLRNDVQHVQQGFFVFDIPTFSEVVVREAVLNAVSHRDYRLSGSVFVRQYPRRLEIVSPGGFPPGISADNILWRQAPRNRRIAEAFSKCGLVERSGQGVNRMFEECIKESKPRPDFSGTDEYQVSLTLKGEIQDPKFVRFLEQIGNERLATFTTRDYLLLDIIHCDEPIPDDLKPRLPLLVDLGVIETVGRGRGVRYILSRQFYSFLGKKGVYTRKQGLDRETNKALLLKHMRANKDEGSQLDELKQVLPSLSHNQIQSLLRELREDGMAYARSYGRGARWFPASEGS